MTKTQTKAIIALGGNLTLGEMSSLEILQAAVEEIAHLLGEQCQTSRLFQTPCFPAGAGPDYINGVLTVETGFSAAELLEKLHLIEKKFARSREQRWGMRTLDLDLIAYGDRVAPSLEVYLEWRDMPLERQKQETPAQLILPHPRIQDRAFVLVPLCDIWPDWKHPILGKTAAELCADLPKNDVEAVQAL